MLMNIAVMGGSLECTESSVATVSFWNIPGGTRYDLAHVVVVYFDDLANAEHFVERYDAPPEMAFLTLTK